MTDRGASDSSGVGGIIERVKTPLGFFVLAILVAEGVLIALVANAEGADRTIGIVGMILVLLASGAAVFFLAYHRLDGLNAASNTAGFHEPLSFERCVAELSPTIERLESNAYELARYYLDQGDLQRLLDGLYSGLLYAAGAVPTGRIEPIFYGNLMEWNGVNGSLRVRYFKGPYNDEIVCRTFRLAGPKQGVASEAVLSKKIQYRNDMESELKERGESLLKAMMSVPVITESGPGLQPGMIVAINIDSIQAGVFPISRKPELIALEKRARDLALLVQRVNELRAELTRQDALV